LADEDQQCATLLDPHNWSVAWCGGEVTLHDAAHRAALTLDEPSERRGNQKVTQGRHINSSAFYSGAGTLTAPSGSLVNPDAQEGSGDKQAESRLLA
jgi:hypothetical protein